MAHLRQYLSILRQTALVIVTAEQQRHAHIPVTDVLPRMPPAPDITKKDIITSAVCLRMLKYCLK